MIVARHFSRNQPMNNVPSVQAQPKIEERPAAIQAEYVSHRGRRMEPRDVELSRTVRDLLHEKTSHSGRLLTL